MQFFIVLLAYPTKLEKENVQGIHDAFFEALQKPRRKECTGYLQHCFFLFSFLIFFLGRSQTSYTSLNNSKSTSIFSTMKKFNTTHMMQNYYPTMKALETGKFSNQCLHFITQWNNCNLTAVSSNEAFLWTKIIKELLNPLQKVKKIFFKKKMVKTK